MLYVSHVNSDNTVSIKNSDSKKIQHISNDIINNPGSDLPPILGRLVYNDRVELYEIKLETESTRLIATPKQAAIISSSKESSNQIDKETHEIIHKMHTYLEKALSDGKNHLIPDSYFEKYGIPVQQNGLPAIIKLSHVLNILDGESYVSSKQMPYVELTKEIYFKLGGKENKDVVGQTTDIPTRAGNFQVVKNPEGTYHIECEFTVYREKFGHHPSFLPQDEVRGRREGFSTRFWFLVEDDIAPENVKARLNYYYKKYPNISEIENDDKKWESFPFKKNCVLYSK